MALIAGILTILLAIVKTEIKATEESRLNQLPDVFLAQIRTPAASAGNNLNRGATPISRKDFQAISTFSEDKISIDEENDESNSNQDVGRLDAIRPLPMVWDNCHETTFKENKGNFVKAQDMEVAQDYQIENIKEIGSSWNKRDAHSSNNTAARNAWVEKYNSLLNSRADERRQQKPDLILVKKITTFTPDIMSTEPDTTIYMPAITVPTTTTFTVTNTTNTIATKTNLAVPIIPITREVFRDEIEILNATHSMVTDSNVVPSHTEDWMDIKKMKNRTKIRFSSLPQRTTYLIPTLRLEDGFHPFSFMSEFFYLIYPFDFPITYYGFKYLDSRFKARKAMSEAFERLENSDTRVGHLLTRKKKKARKERQSCLVKDIVWGEFTFPYSFLQSIKVESTLLACIVIFTCIALVIPVYLFILAVLALFSKSRCADELETGALFPEAEESDCNDRVLVAMTLVVIVLGCALLAGMEVSNEQAHTAGTSSRNVVNCAFTDIAAWLSSAARDLHHSLVPPLDLVLQAFKEDLKNVEMLLGEPIQQAIGSESGIDLVFDSLADIIQESEELATKISSLRDVSIKSGGLASAASDRIKDLARQLDNLKKHCTLKDMPLCDTVNTNSLEMKMKFDLILHEQQLLQLRTLGVENLTRAISSARKEFRSLPSIITMQTEQVREELVRDIVNRRQSVHGSMKVLNDIVRHLTAGLHTASRQLDAGFERVQRYEFARWALMIGCIVILGFVTILIIMALLCGCGHAKIHAQRTLKVSAVWICVASLILWGMISTIFLITGHAEIYVCHALWDSPQYKTLSTLFDRPSPLLSNNEGIFDALFRDLENITIDVTVRDVLRECEKDRPAYIVFQLDKVLDVNKETSYFEWTELQTDLSRLKSSVDVGLLKTISASYSMILSQMLTVSDVNLAKYRKDFNDPVVGKDLPSLIDQLENIAAQVSDLNTAGRLETLALRTQRLHTTSIKPLEQMRADVVFKLTELELQLMPFRRKLNISLSHIHTAQFYIDNQGDVIAGKKIYLFVSRLISHAAGWRTHVLTSVSKHAARCRPLFTVYAAARTLLCTNYIAALHGWWVCGLFLGVLWSTTLTPLCVKLWRIYGWKIKARDSINLANLGAGQQETPTTAPCDDSNWNTPGPPPPPPRSDSW